MKKIIEELKAWGCDTAGALERMVDDEEFYITCLEEISQDALFPKLEDALNSGNVQEAFDIAHTLKGVLANVGLTPMLNKIVEIVEPLRAGNGSNLTDKYEQLIELQEKLKRILHDENLFI